MEESTHYKSTLKSKKQAYMIKEEKLIKEVETKPYKVLDARSQVTSCIPMNVWEQHFIALFQRTNPTICLEDSTQQVEDIKYQKRW